MNRVEDLEVLRLAHELALRIYSTTKSFPKGELFSLIEQTSTGGNLGGHEPDGRSDEIG